MNKELAIDLVKELLEYHPEAGYSRSWYESTVRCLGSLLEDCEGDWIPYDGNHVVPSDSRQVFITYKWSDDDYEVSIGEYWGLATDPKERGFGKYDENVIAWKDLPKAYELKV